MSAINALRPGEIGLEARAAMRDMLRRAVSNEPVATYVSGAPLPWSVVQQGGWDLLGVPEAAGGAGATLRDLVDLAMVWGESIVPHPLLTTIMAKRWSEAARTATGPVTFSVATTGAGGHGVAPFGLEEGVLVLSSAGQDGLLQRLRGGIPDDYAPSLRLVETALVTDWAPGPAAELAVVWAAEATGCAAKMLGDAIAYAKERQQFGHPIGKFQAVKHRLADANIHLEHAETAALWASIEPHNARRATSIAFESALTVVEAAVQVHGGLGFTWEMGLHMYLRHIITLRELTMALPL